MYQGDSYHTLTTGEQIAVLALGVVLAGFCLYAVWRFPGRSRPVRAGWAVLVFWGFVWLSPQVYYTLYLTFFDGLPLQTVIQSPPALGEILALLTFQDKVALAEHGKGILGVALILISLIFPPKPDVKSKSS